MVKREVFVVVRGPHSPAGILLGGEIRLWLMRLHKADGEAVHWIVYGTKRGRMKGGDGE
jgi:hypothetical protein